MANTLTGPIPTKEVEGCTLIEVYEVLKLRDHDLIVRCLEVIRSQLRSILPEGFRFRVEVISLCHHHPSNVYPAFGVYDAETFEGVEDAATRINAWVANRGLDWLVAQCSLHSDDHVATES